MVNTESLYVLTRGDSVGLTIAVEAGLLSLGAVSVTFVMIFINIVRQRRQSSSWRFIEEPMELYIVLLLTSDMLQAIGAVMDARWIHKGEVYSGRFCTAQGMIQQLGETTVAMTTLVIALHTFVAVWWRKGAHALRTAKIIMLVIWVYVILFVALGAAINRHNGYEMPTPFWCWIGGKFLIQRIFGEYLWFWITLLFSIFAYIPLYFCSRGNIVVSEDVWWKFSIHRVHTPDRLRARALGLIAYPLVYSVLIIPVSVVRWIEFEQERNHGTAHVPPAVPFVVVSIFGLSGAANVLLYFTTRPSLLLFRKDQESVIDEGLAPSRVLDSEAAQTTLEMENIAEEQQDLHTGRLPSLADGDWDLPRSHHEIPA